MATEIINFEEHKTRSFEPLLETPQAAELLKVHPKTLQKWARTGIIPGSKIGREWKFRASVLDDFVRSRYTHSTIRAA
jgi:excisionase family DNA binding protein